MAYIIAEPCVDVKDGSCVAVCPVDCIYGIDTDNMLYINPDECIDCGACAPECPVSAIFPAETVPEQWRSFIGSECDVFQKELNATGGNLPGRCCVEDRATSLRRDVAFYIMAGLHLKW